jgi:hypothetical protein
METAIWERFHVQGVSQAVELERFKSRLSRIISWLRNPDREILTSELGQDVLTSFGWHAKEDEDTRHEALTAADGELGEDHVTHILSWLKNVWQNNLRGNFAEYSEIAGEDHDWFCTTMRSDRRIHIVKKELQFSGVKMQAVLWRTFFSDSKNEYRLDFRHDVDSGYQSYDRRFLMVVY